VIVAAADAERAMAHLKAAGETAWRIGAIAARAKDQAQTVVV